MASVGDIAVSNGGGAMAEATDEPVIFLHGDLDLKIVEARRLPNMDIMAERFRRCFSPCNACRKPLTSEELAHPHRKKIITSDPYVSVILAGATVARTRIIPNSQTPKWEEHFLISLAHPVSRVEFQVKDNDRFGAQLIGIVNFSAQEIKSGKVFKDWYPIIGPYGKPPKEGSALYMEMKFTPFEQNPLYRQGIASDPEHKGVRNTYFPVRRGGSLQLYQDAHVPVGMIPRIELDGGKSFRSGQCWEDICHAILEAHHMIYITGWSIYHKVKLIREPTRPLPRGGDLTLGELLKYKSQEGVRVLMLVWDDKTSHSSFLLKTDGVMGTHDEETRKFFKHSSVICVLSPRYASSKLSIVKQKVVGTLFTHHQKSILLDTQAYGNNRKVSAFVGGLDLCDGRYDTPEHRLFCDLDTVFADDYHNPTFPAGTKAPRQPWHDLHCRMEGPAAYDILKNFEQRWRKATKWSEFGQRFKKIRHHHHDDALIKLDRISWILSPSPAVPENDPILWVSNEGDPENWHIQVFRSIDSGSVKGFPKNVRDAEAQNLTLEKKLVIDSSIQTAYIQAIRQAQHFIYIENQYFLGSSFGWPSYKNAGANNLIPMELALKIASKIRAKERFAVYVIIPMWPEGVPNTAAVQEILYWQYQTMQMMYEVIAAELKVAQLENSHPQDYLNFYCLGNREPLPNEISSNEPSTNGDMASAVQKSRRFMIYVHAKGMIVDDEYVIMGSANINERSMSGSRDTEIAMGAYQPHHAWEAKKRHPRGQVYGYRMSLWAEHLGRLDNCFQEPQNLDCVKSVNQIAEDNWSRFAAEEVMSLQGHILKYPVKVDADGTVGPIPDQETFPDVGGKIIGGASNLPDALTT